jgi:hypothetical protein
LRDGVEVTLRVRLPRRGAPSTSRRLYVRKHDAVVAQTMSMSEGVAKQVLDAVELTIGARPRVVNG